MKILLNIVHYQPTSKQYLNELIDEYNKYPYELDIYIHTNKKTIKNFVPERFVNGSISVKKHNIVIKYLLFKNRNYYLTWTPRKLIKQNIKHYDIFIYSEDDILIPRKALDYWLERKNELFDLKYLPGFMLIEKNLQNEEIAVNFENRRLLHQLEIAGNKYLINDNNRYMACWVYDKKMMETWIDSSFFNIRAITTHKAMNSQILDKLKIQNIYIRYWLYNLKNKNGYGVRENSAFGMHARVVPIVKEVLLPINNKQLDNRAKIYHLANSYADSNHPDIGKAKLKNII